MSRKMKWVYGSLNNPIAKVEEPEQKWCHRKCGGTFDNTGPDCPGCECGPSCCECEHYDEHVCPNIYCCNRCGAAVIGVDKEVMV